MLRIDAHHHFWKYNANEYDWLNGELATLRRDFLPADLASERQAAGVSGTVAVQARQTLEETDWLLEFSVNEPSILGVVGWLPLRDPDFPRLLDLYRNQGSLNGLRHVLQGESEGFMDDPGFNSGIDVLQQTGLAYDILILERQLQEATRFVDRHPNQLFILDHIAKPRIAANELQTWADLIRGLARRENVFCKVSGMVTEADPEHWSADQLKPYFDTVLECFTPARLMAGSDWPVLRAGCSYGRWWEILAEWVAVLSAEEQADILGLTAIRTYGLTPLVEDRKEQLEMKA